MEENEVQDSAKPEEQKTPQMINQPATQVSEASKQKPWLIIGLVTLILTFLGTTVFFAYQYYILKSDKQRGESAPKSIPLPVPTNNTDETYEVSNQLSSINIDKLMRGIVSGQIPDESKKIELGYDLFQLKLYQIDLDDNQYLKLNSYLNFTFFPPFEDLTVNNADWKAYSYSEASDLFTKEGYVCHLIRPGRFGTEPSFSCAQVGKLKNNSLENVSNFIQSVFKEAELNCDSDECKFEESEENIPLPMYTRSLLYFENVESPEAPEQLNKVNEELSLLEQRFLSSNWSASVDDYTSTEKKWAPDTLTSQRLVVKNNLYNCIYTITIGNFGNDNKRKMVNCSYVLEALTEKQEEINKALGLYSP